MRTSRIAIAFVVLLAVAACGNSNPVGHTPSDAGLGGTGGSSGSGGVAVAASGGSAETGDGLPCEVRTVLVKYCDSCHGASVASGAPRSLVTYADLIKSDLINTGITEAQAALQRMQSGTSPMPPLPAAAPRAADIATLQSWVQSGYPKGTCGGGTGGTVQGGSSGSGGAGKGGDAGSVAASGGSGGGGTGGANSGSAGGAPGGLPCEIQALMVSRCESCHGSTPSGGAPRSLVTLANLMAADPANPSMTEAQFALARMQSATSPMPPAPASPASSSEIAMLQGWINNGYPPGTCGVAGAGGGAGSGTGGSAQSGAGGSGGGGATGGSDASTSGSLPCDVQTLLVNRCESCHGNTPSGGAPRSLVTYANLASADPASPGMTEAQVALQRMQNTTSPMPPSPASPATSAEIATLQNWISSGYPSGSCSGDAGTPPPDPLNASPTCTSKTTWNRGNEGSSSMDPGQACISCHGRSGGEAPRFVIAGTLYPTGHEPDNCNGANGTAIGAKVVVTDSSGKSVTLTPNSAGNFSSSTALTAPFKAKVVNAAGIERVMASVASTGDCNSCHTQSGSSGAPGRITLP